MCVCVLMFGHEFRKFDDEAILKAKKKYYQFRTENKFKILVIISD